MVDYWVACTETGAEWAGYTVVVVVVAVVVAEVVVACYTANG